MQELIAQLIEARKAQYLAAAAEYQAGQEQERCRKARFDAEGRHAEIERQLKVELDVAAGCPRPPEDSFHNPPETIRLPTKTGAEPQPFKKGCSTEYPVLK